MRGVREKEKGAPLACLVTDGLTQEHGTVCSRLLICSGGDIIELAVLSCLATVSFFFFFCPFRAITCNAVSQSPTILHLLHCVDMLHW